MAINAGNILGSVLGNVDKESALNALGKLAQAGGQANAGAFGDLGDLAKAIQGTDILSAEKIAALKDGLQALTSGGGLSPDALAPLTTLLQSAQNNSTEENQRLWEKVKPYLNDADKLSGLASMLGEYGGKLLALLKSVFLR